jgi:predicted permease
MYAARRLWRRPVSSAVIVLSLTLGIGINTAMFTTIKAILLDRLPVEKPEELVLLRWVADSKTKPPGMTLSGSMYRTATGTTSTSFSYSLFQRFSEQTETLVTLFAFADIYRLSINLGEQTELSDGLVVSGEYFDSLGIRPQLGRLLTRSDDRSDAEPAAVVSHAFWQSRLGADHSAVGRTVRINGFPFTIVGVAPAGFRGTGQVGSEPSLYLPLAHQVQVMRRGHVLDNPLFWWLRIMGRLEPGVSMAAARTELTSLLVHGIEEDMGVSFTSEPGTGELVPPRLELAAGDKGLFEDRQDLVEPLLIAQAVVAVILLIACVNAACLLLARAEERRSEMAIRLSLGARRRRLVRQLLIEASLLALLAGGLGLLASMALCKGMLTLMIGYFGEIPTLNLTPDATILTFTVVVSLLTGLLFGSVPALRASNVHPVSALQLGSRLSTTTIRNRAGSALIVAQMALSLVLLISAGLCARTLHNLYSVDLGFNPEGVVQLKVDPTLNGYEEERLVHLYRSLLERLRALPGVNGATISPYPLLSGSGSYVEVETEDGTSLVSTIGLVDEGFLKTLQIPLLAGRDFMPEDDIDTPRVILVNQTFARRFFGDSSSAVGQNLSVDTGDEKIQLQIIGVYRDSREISLRREARPAMQVCFRQAPMFLEGTTIYLRSHQELPQLIGAAREAVAELDPNLPVFQAQPVTEQVRQSLGQERIFTLLCGLCGSTALILACFGLYGTLSYSVGRRTQELGVRLTLGASRVDIVTTVMREMRLVVIGAVLGLGVAWATTRLLSGMLFQLSATDPMTLILATLLLLGIAAVATYLPARRAASIDVVEALSFE